VTEFGRLDGAINKAGGVSAAGPVHTVGSGAWHAELEQNLTSVFYCLKFQIPAMIGSADGGSIINNASTRECGDTRPGGVRGGQARGRRPHPLGRVGVRGPRRTGQRAGHWQRRHTAVPGPAGRAARGPAAGPGAEPTGGVATPGEVASFAAFLLSEESAFITGAALAIDGGVTAQ
jgi:NAD(P)-dependent dehydrogenase (short-subunit alcohol dehydrogenase family)